MYIVQCQFIIKILTLAIFLKDVKGSASDKNYTLWDYRASPEDIRDNQYELVKLYMNTAVDPCEDFYEYSCGNWGNANALHASLGSLSQVSNKQIQYAVKQLLSEDYQEITTSDRSDVSYKDQYIEERMKNYYNSCMNTALISNLGVTQVLEFLQTFREWPLIDSDSTEYGFDWLNLTAQLKLLNQNYIFSLHFFPSLEVSGEKTMYLYNGDDPLIDNAVNVDHLREQFRSVIKDDMVSDGILNEVINFDLEIKKSKSGGKRTLSIEDLHKEVPEIDWPRLLSLLRESPVDIAERVVVTRMKYFKKLGYLLSTTSPRIICNYLLVRFAYNAIVLMNENILLKGIERSSYCIGKIKRYMSHNLATMFVRRYLNESSKEYAGELAEEMRQSFNDYIRHISWVDEATQLSAIEKLNAITFHIGYTNNILFYDEFPEMRIEYYFKNSMNLLRYYHKKQIMGADFLSIASIDTDAFFVHSKNFGGDIFMSAGILQPPFYNKFYPKWSNYGGIGSIIAHELTHSFNEKFLGLQNGTDSVWWSDESFKEFISRLNCYDTQYSKYKHDDIDEPIHSNQTLDENMADNGGLKIAYDAYDKWLRSNVDSEEINVIPKSNLTGRQLYFISFAQSFCDASKKNELLYAISNSRHATKKFRVIGAISNSKDFAREFECPVGSTMNPVEKCGF